MFKSFNLTSEKIWESNYTQALFCYALGHLKKYIHYVECENAQPGDFLYQKYIDDCIQGKEYILRQKNKAAKYCVQNLLRLGCVDGFIKSYKLKSDDGYYENQNLIINAFSDYVDSVNISLNGRRFFEEADKLIHN